MNRQMWIFVTSIACLFLDSIPASSQSDNPFEGEFWEVRGRWTRTPAQETSFGWYNSEAKAQAAIAQLIFDYGPQGIMANNPDKPFGLYILDPKKKPVNSKPKEKEKTKTDDPLSDVEKNTPRAKGLQDLVNAVKRSYESVKQAKERLVGKAEKMTQAELDQVNTMIKNYNADLQSKQSGSDGSAFKGIPKISPITRESLNNAKRWTEVAKEKLNRETDKDKFDEEKKRLDEEREKLIEEREALEKNPDPEKEAKRKARVEEYLKDKKNQEDALAIFEEMNKGLSQKIGKLPQRVEVNETPSIANLTGTWRYKIGNSSYEDFRINPDGTVYIDKLYARHGVGKVNINRDKVEIVVDFTEKYLKGPAYKWNLTLKDGKLVGESQYQKIEYFIDRNVTEPIGWSEPSRITLEKDPERK